MTVHVASERKVQHEAIDVLWRELGPAKMVRLWASWQLGSGEYLKQRDAWFIEYLQTIEHTLDAANRLIKTGWKRSTL